MTKDGRIACLTNFREEGEITGTISRGAMVNAYLTQAPGTVQDTETFARRLISGEEARGSGGFSLVCGKLGQPLAVVSNRMESADDLAWIAKERGKTVGLSNAAFGDRSWPKVTEGEELLGKLIRANNEFEHDEEDMIRKIFVLLSRDTLPKRQDGEEWSSFVRELRNSVFVPVIGGDESGRGGDEIAAARSGRRMSVNKLAPGAYGTSKQTLILVTHDGHVKFVEKTLYEDGVSLDPASNTRTFEYNMK